jgi:hypothetical protein
LTRTNFDSWKAFEHNDATRLFVHDGRNGKKNVYT